MTNPDFQILADKIVKVFTKETRQTYYTAPVRKRDSRDQKAGVSHGKLVDKYKNKLTFLRNTGLLPATLKNTEVESDNVSSSNGIELFLLITTNCFTLHV